jgi:hypothetical protein
MGLQKNERRAVLIGLLVVVVAVLIPIGLALVFKAPDHAQLRKGLKEKQGLDVKTIEVAADNGGVKVGTITTEQGQSYPIAFHTGIERNALRGEEMSVTEWVLGKQPKPAEEELRKLVKNMGLEVVSVRVQRNQHGVGYIGEITTKSGEVIDVREDFKGPPFSSAQMVELQPGSYGLWARHSLEKELKEEVVSVSDLVQKDKSWAMEDAERQARVRADESERRARLEKDFEAKMEAIRRSGREPTLGDIGAARALLGLEDRPLVVEDEIRKALQSAQNPAPPKVATYKSATVTTKSGREVEVEIEVQTSPSRDVLLRWREKK